MTGRISASQPFLRRRFLELWPVMVIVFRGVSEVKGRVGKGDDGEVRLELSVTSVHAPATSSDSDDLHASYAVPDLVCKYRQPSEEIELQNDCPKSAISWKFAESTKEEI